MKLPPEEETALLLRAAGIEYQREFRFAPPRKWRADFYIAPDILLECEGGVYVGGRHNRARGYLSDISKYNAATARGYRVFRCSPGSGDYSPSAVVETIRALLDDGGRQRK